MIFEAAINAQDRTIVTFNKRDFVIAANRFDVKLVTPREMLEKMK
jgi:predicted nucleic acid-binding protein